MKSENKFDEKPGITYRTAANIVVRGGKKTLAFRLVTTEEIVCIVTSDSVLYLIIEMKLITDGTEQFHFNTSTKY